MKIVTLSKRGQVQMPTAIYRAIGAQEGDKFIVSLTKANKIVFELLEVAPQASHYSVPLRRTPKRRTR